MKIVYDKDFGSKNIHPNDMKNGQIGIIVSWPTLKVIGNVVQKYNDVLIKIGGTPKLHSIDIIQNCECTVLVPDKIIRLEI